jgi:ribosomal protein L16 Arg81 hydroxylase
MSTISILNQVYEEIKQTSTDMKTTLTKIKEKRQEITQLQNQIEATLNREIDTQFTPRVNTDEDTKTMSDDEKTNLKGNLKKIVTSFINKK